MSRQKRFTVAVVGATGAVGTEMLRVLESRRFPVGKIRLLASARSAGTRLKFNGSIGKVEKLEKHSFDGVDVALFSAGASRSLEFAPEAVKRGAIVVDNSSAFRMHDDVPLVIPEVNPHALEHHQGLIANPNCSTIIMLVALKPLHDVARITRIIVSTYQSVSGAGAKAMWQLFTETQAALRAWGAKPSVSALTAPRVRTDARTRASVARVLPNQIAFNVIPQVDVFLGNGSTKEEMKMVNETRKILEAPSLPVSATCARVPVFVSHSEAVWIETEKSLTPEQARRLLAKAPGVRLVDGRPSVGQSQRYPMPIDAAARDEVLVGRIRLDESMPNSLSLWVCGDNLRKGAATNAVQIAELLTAR